MPDLNEQQFEQQTLPGTYVPPTHAYREEDRQWKNAREAGVPERTTMLHFTDKPNFKINKRAKPWDAGDQSSDAPSPIGLFGTNDPGAWRGVVGHRPYVARVEVTGTPNKDFGESGPMAGEEHIYRTGMARTRVLGVHRAHIFRGSWEEGAYDGGKPFANAQYGQASGPKIGPSKQPRFPKLPGMSGPELRPKRALLTQLGRTNKDDVEE